MMGFTGSPILDLFLSFVSLSSIHGTVIPAGPSLQGQDKKRLAKGVLTV